MMADSDFRFGTTTRLGACCLKPLGCTIQSDGCLYKQVKAGNPKAVVNLRRQGFERALALPDHWAEARAHHVALAIEEGREVAECPVHGMYVVEHGPDFTDGRFDCMTREGCDHRELREYAASLGRVSPDD